jgi:endonuclease/exonuclease/phosphatase family metal-dependent hydrolase
MKVVSFNIQYGFGLDGVCDLERIADVVRDADIIGFQEVTRNLPKNAFLDMPARLAELLADFHQAFGPGADVDYRPVNAVGASSGRLQFGNMVLSRFPILSLRNLLLPRSRTFGELNLQRAALEALIDTPDGPIRIYSTHLDHRDPDERIRQIAYLKDRAVLYGVEGGGVTGGGEFGFPDLPHTDDYLILGDFNMMPETPDYIAMAGRIDPYYGRTPRATAPVDSLAFLGARQPDDYSWEEPGKPEVRQYLDYIFASATLTPRLRRGWTDMDCIASDHKPVWLELG